MPGNWAPGDDAIGSKVFGQPVAFARTAQFQLGQVNTAGTPATPGTVASGGTVSNSLGYDVVVYASATTGISAVKVGTVSIPGSLTAGATTDYILPGNSAITISYTGTLSWVWLAK